MNRTHRVVRASFYLALALPFAALACGQSFTAGPGDDGGTDGQIVFGDGGPMQDGTTREDSGGSDARPDAPGDAGVKHDGSMPDGEGIPETGVADAHGMETGVGCPPGFLTCDGGCVQEGPTSCGTCGNDCTTLPHVQGAMCSIPTGQCTVTCLPGWAHCTTNPDDGCETNTTTPSNCGRCGVTCSGGTPVCSSTGCVSGCTGGEILCGSSCANTTNDPQNCNGCGDICPAGPANSQPTCTSSACGWSCDPTYTQCSSSCVNESNDPNHCGTCTNVCAGTANGQPECTNGACAIACNSGYQLCNGNSCIATSPDASAGVFVAVGGGTGSCGSEAQPCGTIAAGLAQIASSAGTKTILYVGNGTYTEQVTLPAGITIQGGWLDTGGVWTHLCDPNPLGAIIAAPTGTSSAVLASYSGTSVLDTVQVQNDQTAGSGVSLYGINAVGASTQLVLNDVLVNVASGGAGVSGNAATPGVAGGTGGGNACTTVSNAGNGSNGPAGAGGAGGYSPAGYTPQPGIAGTSGGNGNDGPAGAMGTCATENSAYCCNTNDGCNQGSANGCTTSFCGSQGGPGCGGTGATAGTPGHGGGSSIGVFVWAAQVTITGGQYSVGNGGTGGNGGAGAAGGAGAVGLTGADAKYPSSCNSIYHSANMDFTCTFMDSTASGTGGAGSTGGSGGSAGQSGGGSGGDSYCWYTGGAGSVTATAYTCSPAAAGQGGSQGAGTSQGANGSVGVHN